MHAHFAQAYRDASPRKAIAATSLYSIAAVA
jgi:hypothetical protein